jgi:hypothetical protein
MAAYRGKDVVVTFNAVNISGDGRSISLEESADVLDDTKWGQDSRTKIASLTDGSGSYEALDSTGDFTAAWSAIAVGSTATMTIQPEGPGTDNREISFTAIITARSLELPYDDLAKFSMSFEISGDVTETTLT